MMDIGPKLQLVMGIDDLQVKNYQITDTRMVIPDHAPADLVAEYGNIWWRCFGYDESDGHIPVPSIAEDAERWKGRKMLLDLHQVYLKTCVQGKRYDDAMFWEPEFGPSNILGVFVGDDPANTYDESWLWALCYLMDWQQPGYRIVPSLRLEQDRSFDALALRMQRGLALRMQRDLAPGMRRIPPKEILNNRLLRHDVKRKYKLIKHGWNIAPFVTQIEGWAEYAGYVLRAVGLHHRRSDLKLMLVWTWS